ncbi:MAG TPA: fused MFS/spermidine synthase [Flavobacteriales bacterium]|nr:fused MFS/spermidine synthase [Flavobacteriales bacterium]
MFQRIFSWLWPMVETHANGKFGRLEVRWENGRKVLNSTHGNQSFGALHRVWQQTFVHLGLKDGPPGSVLLLGLGGGSVPYILREELGLTMPITAIELDPVMLALAREHFDLGRHTELEVITGDATIQLHALKARFDLVIVDLFDDLDLARGVDSRGFMHGLRDRCAPEGIVCFNTVAYDEASEMRCKAVKAHAERVFHAVEELVLEDVNKVFIFR